jgi:hypothetical protein
MHADKPAQRSVDLGLGKPSECDIVVVILGAKLGSPMQQPEYAKPEGQGFYTGTEWEFEEAMRAAQQYRRPMVLIYRRTEGRLDFTDARKAAQIAQALAQVDDFLQACRARYGSIPNPFATPNEFRDRLTRHL